MSVRDTNKFYPVLRKRFWKQSLTDNLRTGFFYCTKMEKEIWKDIKGYEGQYKVSSFGNVVKLDRIVLHKCKTIPQYDNVKYFYKGFVLKKSNHNGYYGVSLNGSFKYVHRLVGNAFVPNARSKKVINHIDFNRKNNFYKNLEWVSALENSLWTQKNGRVRKEENHGMAKFTNQQVRQIRLLYSKGNITQSELARLFRANQSTIHYIVSFKNWRNVV